MKLSTLVLLGGLGAAAFLLYRSKAAGTPRTTASGVQAPVRDAGEPGLFTDLVAKMRGTVDAFAIESELRSERIASLADLLE